MKLCDECDRRDSCVKLCKKAEKFVNQDNVLLSEVLLKSTDIFSESIEYGLKRYTKKSVINLYKDGRSVNDIAYHLPFGKSYIYEVIQKYKGENMDE